MLRDYIPQPSSHLSFPASQSQPDTLFCYSIFIYKTVAFHGLTPSLEEQQVTTQYMKNRVMLCSVLQTLLLFFLFSYNHFVFSRGTHADTNATLTANSTRRTFQSPITTVNQTPQAQWPDAAPCPPSNPAARLLLPLLIALSNILRCGQTKSQT